MKKNMKQEIKDFAITMALCGFAFLLVTQINGLFSKGNVSIQKTENPTKTQHNADSLRTKMLKINNVRQR